METLDLRKQFKHLYNPSAKKVDVVDVPALQFAMVDGRVAAGEGPADSADFRRRSPRSTASATPSSSCSRNGRLTRLTTR